MDNVRSHRVGPNECRDADILYSILIAACFAIAWIATCNKYIALIEHRRLTSQIGGALVTRSDGCWNGSPSGLQGASGVCKVIRVPACIFTHQLIMSASGSPPLLMTSSTFAEPEFDDGLCFLTIKSSSNVKGSYGAQAVIQQYQQQGADVANAARAFADLPSFLQHAILHFAWQKASSRSEQHALRCSCRAAKIFADTVIDAADLSISPIYVDAAVRTLTCFPAQACLKHLTIR